MASAGFDGLVERTDGGIQLGVGAAAMVVVAFGAAALTDHGSVQRVLVMALAVGLGAALMSDWRYSAALGVTGYLLFVGFLVNSYGELSWQGSSALWNVGVFSFGYLLGLGQHWLRRETAEEVAAGVVAQRFEPAASEAGVTVSSR